MVKCGLADYYTADSGLAEYGLAAYSMPYTSQKKWPTFEFVKLTLSKNEIEGRREEQPLS